MLSVTFDEPTTRQLERLAHSRSTDAITLARDAVLSHLRSLAQQAMEQEAAAFVRLHPKLFATIPGEFAAIFKGELIDHDEDQLALLQRIEDSQIGTPVFIRQVTSVAEPVITVLSPRFDNG